MWLLPSQGLPRNGICGTTGEVHKGSVAPMCCTNLHHGFLRICQAAGHQLVRCACVWIRVFDHGSTPFQRLSGRAPCVPSDDGAVTGAKEHQNAEPNTVLTAG